MDAGLCLVDHRRRPTEFGEDARRRLGEVEPFGARREREQREAAARLRLELCEQPIALRRRRQPGDMDQLVVCVIAERLDKRRLERVVHRVVVREDEHLP